MSVNRDNRTFRLRDSERGTVTSASPATPASSASPSPPCARARATSRPPSAAPTAAGSRSRSSAQAAAATTAATTTTAAGPRLDADAVSHDGWRRGGSPYSAPGHARQRDRVPIRERGSGTPRGRYARHRSRPSSRRVPPNVACDSGATWPGVVASPHAGGRRSQRPAARSALGRPRRYARRPAQRRVTSQPTSPARSRSSPSTPRWRRKGSGARRPGARLGASVDAALTRTGRGCRPAWGRRARGAAASRRRRASRPRRPRPEAITGGTAPLPPSTREESSDAITGESHSAIGAK